MNAKRIVGMLMLVLLLGGCRTPQQPALGEPLADLSPEQQAQFLAGKKVFQRVFEPKDGLGPLFNANSCAQCHEEPVLGGVGDEVEVHATRFGAPNSCDPLFHEGGPVIQQDATPLLRALGIEKEQIPPSATAQARRSTPPLFGFGLLDAIPETTLLSHEDPHDSNGDGIYGRANRTIDGRVGRFGRKAAVATLMDFNAGAFPQEMGVTTPQSPVEETINGKPVPPETDPAPDPEITVEDIENVTGFTRFLAPPPQQIFTNPHDQHLAARGKTLFATLKCGVCHVPTMKTGRSTIKSLDRKEVALYSDLLLHAMGAELADICLDQAHPSEFRTEMLMGLRFRKTFLHDGRAKTVQEAIERHDGEGRRSRDKFKGLNERDKQALLKFLETI
jgi:CxxC motif-containing protein (DUF1111 family)